MHTIWLANPNGQPLALISAWSNLDYSRAINAATWLTLECPAMSVPWEWIQRDSQLEIWRDGRLVPTLWLVRGRKKWTDAQGRQMIRIRAQSALGLLERHIVAYRAASTSATKTALVDNMMKAIVLENFSGLATDTARNWPMILVESDTSQGLNISKSFAWRSVLKTLQELSQASLTTANPIFFDMVYEGDGRLIFRTFKGLRGYDHSFSSSNPIEVSLERGTLTEPSLEEDWSQEASYIYAGGAGQEDLRLIATASDIGLMGASPFGRIEEFHNASNAESSATLQAEATARLRARRGKSTFTGIIEDTPSNQYDVHWGFGDQIAATYDGETYTCRVDAVNIKVAAGRETIRAALRTEE